MVCLKLSNSTNWLRNRIYAIVPTLGTKVIPTSGSAGAPIKIEKKLREALIMQLSFKFHEAPTAVSYTILPATSNKELLLFSKFFLSL